MSEGVTGGPIRIGHSERQGAVEALRHHHEAGRIDALEYEERSVKAQAALSTAELEALFSDLPQPHSGRPQAVGQTHTTLTPGAPVPEPLAAERTPRRGVLNLGEPWATTIVSITPILAVILFFVSDQWMWFLAIPLVALLVYGPDGRYDVGPEAALRKQKEQKAKKKKG